MQPGDDVGVAAGLSAEWLTNALGERYPGVAVESFTLDETLLDSGAKLFLSLDYGAGTQKDLPRDMVLKGGFGRRDRFSEFTFDIEALAYRYLVEDIGVETPACYYAGPGPAGAGATVLMENLRNRGAAFCNAGVPLDRGQAEAFVASIARIHAASWNRPDALPGYQAWQAKVGDLRAARAAYHVHVSDPAQWAYYSALPRGLATPMRLRNRETIMAAREQLAAIEQRWPHCITHGDEHLGNFYVLPDGRPGVFDWQSRVAPWAQSYTYFLGAALDIEDRRAWEQDLLRHYLGCLAQAGIAAPSWDEAWTAYRAELLWGFWVWFMNSPDYQSEAVNTANCMRFVVAMLDHDTLGLINSLA